MKQHPKSHCCDANIYNTDYDICPLCFEHCTIIYPDGNADIFKTYKQKNMKHLIINIFRSSVLLMDYCKFIARHNEGSCIYNLEDLVSWTKAQKMQYDALYKNITWERKRFQMGDGLTILDEGKIICDIVEINVIDQHSIDTLINKILKSDEDI